MKLQPLFTEFFLIRLLINTGVMIVLIRLIYYHIYRKRDFFFTFFLINFIVFLLTFMLEKSNAFTISSAFGLLAAFSLLRFRTETISIKDMTYLFIIMTLGLINAIMNANYWELITFNLLIVGAVYLVDGNKLMRNQKTKTVEYDGLENIQPEKHALLIQDLTQRTGLQIQRISIEHIDLVRNRAEIRVYYL